MKKCKKVSITLIFIFVIFSIVSNTFALTTEDIMNTYADDIENIQKSQNLIVRTYDIITGIGGDQNVDRNFTTNWFLPGADNELIGEVPQNLWTSNEKGAGEKILKALYASGIGFFNDAELSDKSKKLQEIIANKDGKYSEDDVKYAKMTRDYLVWAAISSNLNVFFDNAKKICLDKEDNANATGYSTENSVPVGEVDGKKLEIPCSALFDQENIGEIAPDLKELIDKIKHMQQMSDDARATIEPKVSKEVVDIGTGVKDETDTTLKDAEEEAKYSFDFLYDGYITGEQPSFTLENLKDKVNNLIEANKDEKLNSLIDVFKGEDGLIDIISDVGKYIIYAAMLFFGLRCIWSGAEGKAQFKELLPFLLVAVIFLNSAPNLVGLAELAFGSTDYPSYFKDLWASIVGIVRILAFAGIIFVGIKFILASPEGKADIKSSMLPLFIGCIFVFASSVIVTLVINASNEAGLKDIAAPQGIESGFEMNIEKNKAYQSRLFNEYKC